MWAINYNINIKILQCPTKYNYNIYIVHINSNYACIMEYSN